MTTEQRKSWLMQEYFMASGAINTLSKEKKQRVSEYDERIRKLQHYTAQIYIKSQDLQQLELFDMEGFRTPELKKLMDDPTHGLN